MRYLLTITAEVDSAAGDPKLMPKVVDALRAGDQDVVMFGVTRVVSKAKRVNDHITTSRLEVRYEEIAR